MATYPAMAVASVVAVVGIELAVWRTGLLRQRAYWITMAIVFGFMVLVDGWLTKLSAPIVVYNPDQVSGLRPVWGILVEEYAYAFALITLVLLGWERGGPRARRAGDVS